MLRLPSALLAAAMAAAVSATSLLGRTPGGAPSPDAAAATWTYLSDLPWERASSEWLKMGNEGLPAADSAFYTGAPLMLGRQTFSKGLGYYAPSEVLYRLEGAYSRFEATIGVEDDRLPGRAGARFLLFLDGVKAYESRDMDHFDDPTDVSLSVQGISELRLVAVRSSTSLRGAHVIWADARLLRDPGTNPAQPDRSLQFLRDEAARLAQRRAAQAQRLAEEAALLLESLPAGLRRQAQGEGLPAVTYSPGDRTLSFASDRLVVLFGLGGDTHGAFSVLDIGRRRLVARNLTSSFQLADRTAVHLHWDTDPLPGEPYTTQRVEHPVLGAGVELGVPLDAPRQNLLVTAYFTLFQSSAVLLYRLEVSARRDMGGPVLFRYFDAASDAFVQVGEEAHYLADLVRLRHVVTYDDGLTHQDYTGWGKPFYLWSAQDSSGLLLALLDETTTPPFLTYRLDPGGVAARIGLSAVGGPAGSLAGTSARSAQLYLEMTEETSLQGAFSRYRALAAYLYPVPPLPSWVKYQWLSWYVYYMDQTEDDIVRQIDLIAQHFSDLGPWHVLVDAGWYIAEGREGAQWRNQDSAKFPRGLRWLADYAHSKGVRVVLYFNAPYLDSLQSEGDWMGLRGIVEEHPEWLVSLDDGDEKVNYVYNFRHPGLRDYLQEVMRDYFLRYDVDGIKLDGLGNGGDAVLYSPEGWAFRLSERALTPTLDIYRFVFEHATSLKPDAYVESGWITPALANPYSHTFRYGDEEPVFSRPYPLPGLMEHIDYAAFQQGVLGQRANMGALYGDPNESAINRWWLGAGLALGTQVVLSFDLGILPTETISQYRALLAPYRPFEGVTVLDRGLEQRIFATQVGDTWYVGVLNRAGGARLMTVRPAAVGLPPETPFVAYDVEEQRSPVPPDSTPLTLLLPPESFRLLVFRTDPGVLWSNSRIEGGPTAEGLVFRVLAPPTVDGVAHIYAPGATDVYWDGDLLPPLSAPSAGPRGYYFNVESSLLTVWYPPEGEHVLHVMRRSQEAP